MTTPRMRAPLKVFIAAQIDKVGIVIPVCE
jgi:hypothetical protein